MLSILNQYAKKRTAWFLLFISTVIFEITALYFQYHLNLAPCTLCIYQRCAIYGIMGASLFPLIAPRQLIVRLIALAIWLFSAYQGFKLATFHAQLQFEPQFLDSCSVNVNFPNWLPLNTWLPSLFEATGSCSKKIWSFLTIEMSQWMIINFTVYFLVGIAVLIAQFYIPCQATPKTKTL